MSALRSRQYKIEYAVSDVAIGAGPIARAQGGWPTIRVSGLFAEVNLSLHDGALVAADNALCGALAGFIFWYSTDTCGGPASAVYHSPSTGEQVRVTCVETV